jgi:hypothetical protein
VTVGGPAGLTTGAPLVSLWSGGRFGAEACVVFGPGYRFATAVVAPDPDTGPNC